MSAQDVWIPPTPITATKAHQGVFGSATIQIRDANNDEQITKPLIVAEGLDTGLMGEAGSIGDTDIYINLFLMLMNQIVSN